MKNNVARYTFLNCKKGDCKMGKRTGVSRTSTKVSQTSMLQKAREAEENRAVDRIKIESAFYDYSTGPLSFTHQLILVMLITGMLIPLNEAASHPHQRRVSQTPPDQPQSVAIRKNVLLSNQSPPSSSSVVRTSHSSNYIPTNTVKVPFTPQ